MSGRTNPLPEAYELARKHGFVIASDRDCVNPTSILAKQYVAVYILYRNRVRLGKRREPAALLRLIKQTLAADRERSHAYQSPPVY